MTLISLEDAKAEVRKVVPDFKTRYDINYRLNNLPSIELEEDRKTEPITHDDYIESGNDYLEARCLNCNNAKACKEKHWEGCIYEPKDEKTCETCRHWKFIAKEFQCETTKCQGYEPKTEPQTEDGIMPEVKAEVRLDENNKTLWIKTDTIESFDRIITEDGSNWCRIFYEECGECAHNKPRSNDEPQTDCSWK